MHETRCLGLRAPRRIVVLAILGVAAGCGPTSFGDGAGDGGGRGSDAGADTCTGDEGRCLGSTYQHCVDGTFLDVETCAAPLRCSPSIGCAACDPAAGSTCVGSDIHACTPAGAIGPLLDQCPPGTCAGGRCVSEGCADSSLHVYVVTDGDVLMRFEPANDAHTFTEIGRLDCPAGPEWPARGGDEAHPYSMSVDRQGRAWVLYTSGELFQVSTTTAACSPTAWTPGTAGFELFGMGFVSVAAGSSEERLFISGGGAGAPERGHLGVIDPNTLMATPRAPLVRRQFNPELTGTGNAELFAYYPGQQSNAVVGVQQQNASLQEEWPLPALTGIPVGWAFAHWGGRFYIFLTEHDLATISSDSRVYRLDPMTGAVDLLRSGLPYKIVGAGVSTCAPIVVD